MDANEQSNTETTLCYDEHVAYEDQVSAQPTGRRLADRIGNTKAKVYFISDATPRDCKRKREIMEQDSDVEMEQDEGTSHRPNALLFHGLPISRLPTDRLFAYATHFDARPVELEWVDDSTCILVFETVADARAAQRLLQKSLTEEFDLEGFISAKPIPITLWPPEERINKSLGKGEGLKGAIRMRWARQDDVKRKGAGQFSEFYKKHGAKAGKEDHPERGDKVGKKLRRTYSDDALQKAKLDEELDNFLASEEESISPSPPSKMYADQVAAGGRSLLERTSVLRMHSPTLADRITAPLPRRAARLGQSSDARWTHDGAEDDLRNSERRNGAHGVRRRSQGERPRISQQELDDELEAFLSRRD